MATNNNDNLKNIAFDTTWTPTLTGAGVTGTTVYSAQNGYYTQLGNLIILQCWIDVTSCTGTGDVLIGGLPFTIKSQSNGDVFNQGVFNAASFTWPTNTTQFLYRGLNNTATIKMWCIGSAATSGAFMQMSNITQNHRFTLMHMI